MLLGNLKESYKMFLLIGFFVLIGIIFILFVKFSFWRYKYAQLLPGKRLSFFNIFGDIKEAITSMNSSTKYALHLKFLDIMRDRSEMFRKEQLFCIWIFYTPVVFLIKAGAVKEMLLENKLMEKSWLYKWFKPLFGRGILTRPYDEWKPRRKLLNHCFHPDVLRGFLPVFNDSARKLVRLFEEKSKEYPDVTHCLQLCTLDIICETVFGVKLETLGNDKSQYGKSLQKVCEVFMERLYKFWQWPDFVFWNSPTGRKAKFHLKVLKDFTKNVIQDKKERYFPAENKIDQRKLQTVVDILLQMLLDTQELTEEDIENETNTLMLVGHDTIAITVSWALFLIGHSPEVQAKIHQEVDRVFGTDVDKEATEDDLNQLPYLDCVIKETLRLYPPIPIFGREVEEDTNIYGYTIPKGALCLVSTYFLHRDEEVFPNPEKFDPDRFSPENREKIPKIAYIPFSAGPRKCIGYKYATAEVKILLSAIFRNFTVQSLDERSQILPVLNIVLRPSAPIHIEFHPRKISKT